MMVRENVKYTNPPLEPEFQPGDVTPDSTIHQDQSVEEHLASRVKPVNSLRKGRKAIQEFLRGDYLNREWVTGNIPYLLYLALLAMIYIGNTYSTERRYKEIEKTKSELAEYRYHYITAKAALMFQGRQSEISKRAINQGLKETMHPPFKIFYSGTESKPVQKDEGR